MSYLMNHGCVCRTAPATPGLLIRNEVYVTKELEIEAYGLKMNWTFWIFGEFRIENL